MVQPDSWKNCPFPVLPKEERVRTDTPAICKCCNSMKPVRSSKYLLCGSCASKYIYYGSSCDIPNCDTLADGSVGFWAHKGKIICGSCKGTWVNTYKSYEWDRFVEYRHLMLMRPPTFVKALAKGLVSPVKNPVRQGVITECKYCERDIVVSNTEYELCSSCVGKLKYYGEKCSIGGTEPCPNDVKVGFDIQESRFVCKQCSHAKNKFNFPSFHFYETQIRTITECMLCLKSISHNKAEGKVHCSAHIDHDHNTGKIRGVLCTTCNLNEGKLKAWAEKLNTDLLGTIARLETYYQNCEIGPTKV